MDGPFDSAWLKWAWACSQAEMLYAEIEAFGLNADSHPIVFTRTEYHPRRHGFAMIVDPLTDLPVTWPLRLGDIAFNFRSALDHLAWAVVGRGRTPPHQLTEYQQRSVVFPIEPNRQAFAKNVTRKLPGARRADIAIVRRYQPYLRGPSRASWQCLSILQTINNRDKHQEIRPVLRAPSVLAYTVTSAQDCKVSNVHRVGRAATMEVGTELGLIPVKRTGPNPELKVNVTVSALVCLENRVTVDQWIQNTRAWIADLLNQFSGPPPSVVAVLPGERAGGS